MEHIAKRRPALALAAKRRDAWTCVCCALPGDEAHHIHPIWLGGADTLENLATVCPACHENVPEDPNAFLAYQAAGGAHHAIWGQVSADERSDLFFRLPWASQLQDLPRIGGWKVQREEWLQSLAFTPAQACAS